MLLHLKRDMEKTDADITNSLNFSTTYKATFSIQLPTKHVSSLLKSK